MLVECPYCKCNFNTTEGNFEKFENRENEFLQNEILKFQKRLDKLKNIDEQACYKSPCEMYNAKFQIPALTKIINILERYI